MTVLRGDCNEVMAGMEPDSIDAIVTDPPYDLGQERGWNVNRCLDCDVVLGGQNTSLHVGHKMAVNRGGFMGKEWDGTGVAFRPATWAAVLRVAKPASSSAHVIRWTVQVPPNARR